MAKIVTFKKNNEVLYPTTHKEAVLGLRSYDASWLYGLIYDRTAYTTQQVSELRQAILDKENIYIFESDPTIPTGSTSFYHPNYVSASNDLTYFGSVNVDFTTNGTVNYSANFMTTDQGTTWTLNNFNQNFLVTRYSAGFSWSYSSGSGDDYIVLPGLLTISGTVAHFSICLGAPISASSVTINSFKGNIRISNSGYWLSSGYTSGGVDYLNTSGLTVTASINSPYVNFKMVKSSAQSGTENNTPMSMELNSLSLRFS